MKVNDRVRVVKDTLRGTAADATGYYRHHEGDTGRIVAVHEYTDPVPEGFPDFPYEVRLDGRDYSSMFGADELEAIE